MVRPRRLKKVNQGVIPREKGERFIITAGKDLDIGATELTYFGGNIILCVSLHCKALYRSIIFKKMVTNTGLIRLNPDSTWSVS